MAGPDAIVSAFTIASFAITAFLIAFVVAQRASSKGPSELEDALRSIKSLDNVSRDVEGLKGDLATADATIPADVIRDLSESGKTLDEVAHDLRRALEKTV